MVVPLASRHARVHLVAPVDHVSSDWAEGSADTHVGSIHLVKEYFTGMPAVDLAIQFRDAAEFFGAEAYRAARDSGAISPSAAASAWARRRNASPTGEVLGGRLLHIGRDTKWGWRCAATYMGQDLVADGWTPDQLQAEFSDDFGRALLMHCYNEFTFLSRFLPGIYAGDNRDAAGDAALVSAAPQATDTRRIPSPPGHGVPRTVDPKQGLEYAVAKAAHHGQRPHRP